MTETTAAPSLALRRAYRKAGPQTWALIRELYLAGVPAAELSVQFDVSVHTVRKRATREGWSRKAQAEAVPSLRLPPGAAFAAIPAGASVTAAALMEEDPEDEADPIEVARVLLRQAAGAAQAGRLAAATERVKLAEALARAARALGLDDEGESGVWADDEEEELSPEERLALEEEVIARFSRYDRAPAEEDEGEGSPSNVCSGTMFGDWG